MTVKGIKGKNYILENAPIAKGGEGEIYNLYKDKEFVAKIYSHTSSELEKKLLYMVKKSVTNKLTDKLAWPIDVVYDIDGNFVGFVMKKISVSQTLSSLYSTSEYRRTLLVQRLYIAKLICEIVSELHKLEIVIGDFNPNNILIDIDDGKICMIDVDSYQITNQTQTYGCVVGHKDYLAPELSEKKIDKASVSFNKYTDNFALAVHVFQLIMNGTHPFSCQPQSKQVSMLWAPRPDENIANGVFPFMNPVEGTTIPSCTPTMDILPPEVNELFKRAFVEGKMNPSIRPSPGEWIKELTRYSKNLSFCKNSFAHQYYKGLEKCPICEIEVVDGKAGSTCLYSNCLSKDSGAHNFVFLIDTSHNMMVYREKIDKIIDDVFNKIINESINTGYRTLINESIIQINKQAKVIEDFTPISNSENIWGFCYTFDDEMDIGLGLRTAIEHIHSKEKQAVYFTPWIFIITGNDFDLWMEEEIKSLLEQENRYYRNWCLGGLNICVIDINGEGASWKAICDYVYSYEEFMTDVNICNLMQESVIEMAHSGPIIDDSFHLAELPEDARVVPLDW